MCFAEALIRCENALLLSYIFIRFIHTDYHYHKFKTVPNYVSLALLPFLAMLLGLILYFFYHSIDILLLVTMPYDFNKLLLDLTANILVCTFFTVTFSLYEWYFNPKRFYS